MPAPKGHPMWANMRNPKKFKTPKEMWDLAIKYFQWCDDNPWYKNEAIKSGNDAGKIIHIPTQRPYTIIGLCNYLKINEDTFLNYQHKKGYEKFFGVSKEIRSIIEQNQIEGATINAYNHNIIARLLGLIDKTEKTIKTHKPIKIEIINADDKFPDNEDDIDLTREKKE